LPFGSKTDGVATATRIVVSSSTLVVALAPTFPAASLGVALMV
jgi:hypothetical protein